MTVFEQNVPLRLVYIRGFHSTMTSRSLYSLCKRFSPIASSGIVFPLVLIEDCVNDNHQSSASAGGGSSR